MMALFWTDYIYVVYKNFMFLYKADFAIGARGIILIKNNLFKHGGLQILAEIAFSWAGMHLSWC